MPQGGSRTDQIGTGALTVSSPLQVGLSNWGKQRIDDSECHEKFGLAACRT